MISSNISGVISRLRQIKTTSVETAKELVISARSYPNMRALAESAMINAARTEAEIQAIPNMLATFAATTMDAGMVFSMRGIPIRTLGLPDFWKSVGYDQILAWVKEHKDKDDRDRDEDGEMLPDEVIAERVAAAVRADPERWLSTDNPGHGALNPTGLAAVTGLVGLSSEATSRLLNAAMDAWVEAVCYSLPKLLASRLTKP